MTFITPRKVFAHLDRLAEWQNSGAAAPVTVEWDLSNRCSLACQSCHFAHTHVRGPWASRALLPMAYDTTGDLADMALVKRGLREMALAGVLGVVWSGGGEPTLHPGWQEIVAYGASQGLAQGMYTLGGHIGPQAARLVSRTLEFVVVSLDAADAATYADEKGVPSARFEEACDGIRLLASGGGSCTVGVSFLLHAGNWTRARAMLDLARLLGATYATFRPAIETLVSEPGVVEGPTGWIDAALPVLEKLAEEPDVEVAPARFAAYREWSSHGYASCYGIRLSTTVTPDGRVWVCPQRRGIEGSCLGDLRTESFGELWSRHPGHFAVDSGCRAMCRLHQVNEVLAEVFAPRRHAAFV